MNLLTPVLFFTTITVGEVLSSKFSGPTALPVVLHSGYLADTHEVAAAKSAHLATLSHQSNGKSYERHGDFGYQGHTNLSDDGHLVDTPEVAAAKAEHFAAVAKARAQGGYSNGGDYSGQYAAGYDHHSGDSRASHGYGTHAFYHGSPANTVVLHDGHIADTHEVAAAKAEHFAAIAKARSHGGYYNGGDYSGQYAAGYDHTGASEAHHEYGTHASYHEYLAKPVVLHDGHIADTHEVAAAKAEHFSAVANARAQGGYHNGGDYSGQYSAGNEHHSGTSGVYHGYGSHDSHHGTIAKPVVLPSGYLADTHEVAHAKQQHINLLHSSRSGHHNL